MRKQEMETIVRRCADEQIWDCYSIIPREMRRLRQAVTGYGGEIVKDDENGLRVRLPLTAISIRQKKRQVKKD